jgi:hypothetical protein
MDGFYWRWGDVVLRYHLQNDPVAEEVGREIQVAEFKDGPWRAPTKKEKRLLGFTDHSGLLMLPIESPLHKQEGGFLGAHPEEWP